MKTFRYLKKSILFLWNIHPWSLDKIKKNQGLKLIVDYAAVVNRYTSNYVYRLFKIFYQTELGIFEWFIPGLKFDPLFLLISRAGNFWMRISGLMLSPLFFLISRLNNACSPLYINLQINLPIGIKDIPF